MAFENSYPNRKDWRKPYHDSRAIDGSCRSHGDCPWCEGSRTHKKLKAIPADEAAQVSAFRPVHDRPHRRYMHDKLLRRGDIRWDRAMG